MAFFKRKPKLNNRQKGGVFDPTLTEVYDKEYENLFEALAGELGQNSKDKKIITISFPDRDVVLYADSDHIVNVLDPKFNFNIETRIYWAKDALSIEDMDKILRINENSANKHNSLFNYVMFKEEFLKNNPVAVAAINKMCENAAYNNLAKINKEFNKNVKVTSEIAWDKNEEDRVNRFALLENVDVPKLKLNIETLENNKKSLLKSLNISEIPYSDVVISRINSADNYEPHFDEEYFILEAGNNNATLEEIKENSEGFSWATILENILYLKNYQIIDLQYPGQDEAFPDFDELPEIETPEDEIENYKIDLLNFVTLSKNQSEEHKIEVNGLIERNAELEFKVLKDTVLIDKLVENYDKVRDELTNRNSSDFFEDVDETETSLSEEEISKKKQNTLLQNAGNEKFDEINKLELSRREANLERLDILTKIKSKLDMFAVNVLIDERIETIKNTKNATLSPVNKELKAIEEDTLGEYLVDSGDEEVDFGVEILSEIELEELPEIKEEDSDVNIEITEEGLKETEDALENLLEGIEERFENEIENEMKFEPKEDVELTLKEESSEEENENTEIDKEEENVEIDLDNAVIYNKLMERYLNN